MTVSMFDTYLERMHLHRSERMMDTAQANLYAQATNEGRTKMWDSWTQVIAYINAAMIHGDAMGAKKNPITWNGVPVSIKGLSKRFMQTFGKGAVE
jgi:hypothetical protein